MYTYDYKLRVRYADTDQMGYVYYGNYATFYEIGRVESMRSLGISYKKLEELGIMMPVLTLHAQFLKPIAYDDMITIRTIIEKLPLVKIDFNYEIYSKNNALLNTGATTLVFIHTHTKRPCRVPNVVVSALQGYFS